MLLDLLEEGKLPEYKVSLLSTVDETVHEVGVLDDLRRYDVAALFLLAVEQRSVEREGVPQVVVARVEADSG